MNGVEYNQRLFSGGIRKWLHEARFHWLSHTCRQLGLAHEVVMELGCFDARSISYLPSPPRRYYGFDANWEGGLDRARHLWRNSHDYVFVLATTPQDLMIPEQVDLSLCLETVEHIPTAQLRAFLERLASALKPEGTLLMTVPNEKGIVFLAKHLTKRLFFGDCESYSAAELVNATLGRMQHVKRREHKGFDWQRLLASLGELFVVVRVQGVQFRCLPAWANAQIGFVLRPRR